MHSLQSIGVSVSNSWAAAHFPRRSFALTPDLICWSSLAIDLIRQNARTCLDGPDKMPTKKLGRTKCQPQKKVRTKCQPLVGIMSGWHFVRLAFWPTTVIVSEKVFQTSKKARQNANLWLALCPVGILSAHLLSAPSVLKMQIWIRKFMTYR